MLTESLKATEELGAAGAKYPRVKLSDIEAAIERVYYITAGEALGVADDPALGVLTLCFVQMHNGFVFVGKAAPASPENFDREKGRTFAYEDAVRQIWPHMGFALRDRLAENSGFDRTGKSNAEN
jgi:hypothetical protein